MCDASRELTPTTVFIPTAIRTREYYYKIIVAYYHIPSLSAIKNLENYGFGTHLIGFFHFFVSVRNDITDKFLILYGKGGYVLLHEI